MAGIDLSLPPEAVLVQRINEAYNKNFTLDEVYFDLGSIRSVNHQGCDTSVVMRPRPRARLTGALRVYYNRIDLSKYLKDQVVYIPERMWFTGSARPHILNEIGIRLGVPDIISDVIPEDAQEGVLRISKQSLIYAGSVKFTFTKPDEGGDGPLLTDRIQNLYLNGFYSNSVEVTA